MVYMFVTYWIVCGLAVHGISLDRRYPIACVLACLLMGGIIMPLRLIMNSVM